MFKLKLETIKRSWPKVDNTPKSFYLKHLERNTKIILVMLVNNLQKEEMFLAIKLRPHILSLIPQLTLFSKRWSNYPWKWMFMTGHFCCRETPSRFFFYCRLQFKACFLSDMLCHSVWSSFKCILGIPLSIQSHEMRGKDYAKSSLAAHFDLKTR